MASRYDKRLDKLEEKLGEAGQLPVELRGPYPIWRDPASTDADVEHAEIQIKERLVKKYGTSQGAQTYSVGWTKSEQDTPC